jgi:hypothetical protein
MCGFFDSFPYSAHTQDCEVHAIARGFAIIEHHRVRLLARWKTMTIGSCLMAGGPEKEFLPAGDRHRGNHCRLPPQPFDVMPTVFEGHSRPVTGAPNFFCCAPRINRFVAVDRGRCARSVSGRRRPSVQLIVAARA